MSRFRWPVLAVALVSALLLLCSGIGVRLGLWHFRTGFTLLRWTVYLGVAAAILSVVLLVALSIRGGRGRGVLVLALLLGLGAAYLPYSQLQKARSLPPIHDITTDVVEPPPFVAVLPLRAGASNKAEYGGEEIAAKQKAGYPDIQPLHLDAAPAEAFPKALAAAKAMGWEIVAENAGEGRIEATATTFWFGFKDDVVLRLRPDGTGTRVDMRSVSRVGGSDVGANAARIRAFFARLN